MSEVRAAYDPNRLPWLDDTDVRRAPRDGAGKRPAEWRSAVVGGLAALILVAAGGYWAGLRSVDQIEAEASREAWESDSRVALPAPEAPAPAPPMASPQQVQQLQPVAPPAVVRMAQPVAPPEAEPALDASDPATAPVEAAQSIGEQPVQSFVTAIADMPTPTPPPAQPPALAKPSRTLWPADISQGAAGRAVRIGTYPSRLTAKRAWSRLTRVYPGIRRLKAVVVPVPSARNGRTYYRLQFGTTSQAHSAVLCQRMRIVGQSCVVVGAPAA